MKTPDDNNLLQPIDPINGLTVKSNAQNAHLKFKHKQASFTESFMNGSSLQTVLYISLQFACTMKSLSIVSSLLHYFSGPFGHYRIHN